MKYILPAIVISALKVTEHLISMPAEKDIEILLLSAMRVHLHKNFVRLPNDTNVLFDPSVDSILRGRIIGSHFTIFNSGKNAEFPVLPVERQWSLNNHKPTGRRLAFLNISPRVVAFRIFGITLRIVYAVDFPGLSIAWS